MELFYKALGQGKPVIILPGLLGMSDNWHTFSKKLADNFKLYLVDLRNHGRSFHSDVFQWEVMVEDLNRFIESHTIKMPTILGHSMGGKVAMQFAQIYPEKLAKLVVADIAPKAYANKELIMLLNRLQQLALESMHTRKEIEGALSSLVPEQGFRQFIMKNIYRTETGRFGWRPNLNVIAINMDKVGKAVVLKAPFFKPTLFVRGAHSDYILEKDLELIQTMFPNFILKTVENAGHWVRTDQPQLFFDIVDSFLNDSCH